MPVYPALSERPIIREPAMSSLKATSRYQ